MRGVHVERFAGGSVRITEYPWFLVGDGDLRVPLDADALFDGQPRALEITAQEVAGVFGAAERRRLASVAVAAWSALMYAGGAGPAGFRLLEDPDGAYAATSGEDRDDLPLIVMIAAQLAAQLAKERVLRVEGKGEPRQLVAAALLGASGLALLPTAATEPVALLYGPLASAPEDFAGGAVHMDYLRERARAWIEENWVRIDALAEAGLARGEMDAASIERVLTGDGAGEPVRALTAEHPLRRPTPIPHAVFDAVADYWSAALRRKLVRASEQPVDPAAASKVEEQVEVFRRTLAEQIAVRIQRRESRGDRCVQKAFEVDEIHPPFSVGVRFEPDPVLQDALTAAGLRPTTFYGLLKWVEFEPTLVREVRASGGVEIRTVLWTATGGYAVPAGTQRA